MFIDLNVPWPDLPPTRAYPHITSILRLSAILGYDVVALNVNVSSIKGAREFLHKNIPDELWNKLREENPSIKLLKRVTLTLDDTSTHQNISQLVEDRWQVIAVCPKTEKQLQTCASSLDIDIICVDTKVRPQFVLKHKLVCSAVARGVRFEVCYVDATTGNAKQCIANASMLFRASRNRGVIVSSGVSSIAGLRAPLDVVNLLTLWGLKQSAAYASVTSSAEAAAVQGILRCSSVKQTVLSKAAGRASDPVDGGPAPKKAKKSIDTKKFDQKV